MEVVPCSRVAHLSRHHLPYRFPDQELLQRNKIRVADTWMEAYRKIFYRRDTLAHFIRQVRTCPHGPGKKKKKSHYFCDELATCLRTMAAGRGPADLN